MSYSFASYALTAALMGAAGVLHANELEAPPVLPSLDAAVSLDRSVDTGRSSVLFGQTLPRGFLPGFDSGLTTASDATADTAARRLQSRGAPERGLFDQRRPLTYMNNLLRLDY